MIKLNYKLIEFARRFLFFACCNLFDALILFKGYGIRTQIALIAVYRWVLYTPKNGDLQIFMLVGLFWDAIYNLPFGFNSFLILLIFTILNTQKRYLQVNQQYIRWAIFLGFLIVYDQIEYFMHFLIGQKIVLSIKLYVSLLITFSFYPLVFKYLQYYDR